ncbi:MAG TPA: hypothetical protein VEU96_27050 [Bryobacteraceae bacterium]|nr:hypothetical protein [Bryobacteraceae bacterium]
MIREYILVLHGQPLWPILWSSYWGHRMVIGRLIFFADARWGSLASLTWLLLLLQFAHIALILALARLLLWSKSRACFVLACAVTLNLMLAPDQMENFIWRNQILYVLVFAAATASFLLLAAAARRRRFCLPLSILAAVLATCTMGNGFLVWPALVAEAVALRLGRRTVIAIATIGAAVIGFYTWHYEHPTGGGMGVASMIRHPIDAIRMLGLYLAGPLDFLSMPWGTAAAIVALVALAYLAFIAWRQEHPWIPALLAIMLFILLTAASVVAGRLSPQWLGGLHGSFPLPSRYFTPIYLFWACTALLVLYTCWLIRPRPLFLSFFAVLFLLFLFGRIRPQLIQAEDWADFFRATDALGSAIILEVPDEQLLSALWPTPAERNERIAFMRENKLSVFAEPRAAWPGKRISDLFRIAPENRCIGGIEVARPINSQGFRSWRLEGWAWDNQTDRSPADILLADDQGRVVGLGRGELRHGYYPGLPLKTAAPPSTPAHATHRHSEWLGYARIDDPNASQRLTAYGLLPDRQQVCAVGVY